MSVNSDKGKEVGLFEGSLEAIKKEEGYLGDLEAVEALLRLTANDILRILQRDELSDEKLAKIRLVCVVTGDVLLGKLQKWWIPVKNWNQPGGIDVFCAQWLGCDSQDPRERMEQSVLKMAAEIVKLVKYIDTPGVLVEQWSGQFESILQKYVSIFCGISPSTMRTFL